MSWFHRRRNLDDDRELHEEIRELRVLVSFLVERLGIDEAEIDALIRHHFGVKLTIDMSNNLLTPVLTFDDGVTVPDATHVLPPTWPPVFSVTSGDATLGTPNADGSVQVTSGSQPSVITASIDGVPQADGSTISLTATFDEAATPPVQHFGQSLGIVAT